MKKIGTGVICLLFVLLFVGNAVAAPKVLVLVASSEERVKNVGTYLPLFEGLEESLKTKNITPEYMYTDLEAQPTDAAKLVYADGIIAKIKAKKPDVVVSLADSTVKYVASRIDSVPCIFAYVYGSLESMGLPKPNVTGVARRSYAPDIWGLAHKLFGARTVAMLSKNSMSMAGVKKVLTSKADGLEKLSGVRFLDMYLMETFAEWQDYVNNFSADFIYIADPSRLTREDGTQLTRAETIKWTVDNAKVPVIAATGEDVRSGALYTILTSEKEWGKQTGMMVLKFLGGAPIDKLPVETVKKGALIINGKTAVKYQIDFPYEILSAAEQVIE